MKRTRYGVCLLFILAIITILQACSKRDAADDKRMELAVPDNAYTIAITALDYDGHIVAEHREPEVIEELLQGMREARPSYIGDPEQSGKLYELVITSGGGSRTLSLNDLSGTGSVNDSVKLYEKLPDEERARAWTLSTAWIQLLLNESAEEEEPELLVTLDEDNDSVTLTANRNIDLQSVRDAIHATLWAALHETKPVPAEYTLDVTDSRRMVVRFPDLPEGARVGFKLEGAAAASGRPFHIRSPQDGSVITMWQGLAWSGLRWLNMTGSKVHEHGFDSAALIQPSHYKNNVSRELLIYNHDQTVYRLKPDNGEIEDVTAGEGAEEATKYYSEYGVNTIYSYPDEQEGLYVAQGLQTIYYMNPADGTKKQIYESDRPIYGMAASPDGRHIAILADSELNLGPSANLLILDAKGKTVSEFPKASYMGHSEGWHFIYPVRWMDNETVAVPQLVRSAEAHNKGKALFHYKKGLLSIEEDPALPKDAAALLESEVKNSDGEMEITRVLPKPDEEAGRYYAVSLADSSIYVVDRDTKKVTSMGAGSLVMWTSDGRLVVWQSTEGKSVVYVGMETAVPN